MAEKIKDLRELSDVELVKKLRDLREELLNSRLSKQTGQLEKSHLLKELRRDIARVQTLLKQKNTTASAS